MNTTIRLLERWKKTRSITSDNAAAIELGIGRQTISRWRNEDTNAEPATIERMARDVNEDPAAWVLAVEAAKQKPDSQKVMLALARRLGYAALVLLSIGAGQLPIM